MTACTLAVLGSLTGCQLAPMYTPEPPPVPERVRPSLPAPEADASSATNDAATAPSLPRLAWTDWVRDARLRAVVAAALEHNSTAQQALLNVERARALYGLAEASRWPAIGLSAQGSRARSAADLTNSGQAITQNQFSVQLGLTSFELDIWGRVRNLRETALQQYLAQTQVLQGVQLTLIGDVIQAWLALAANEQRLQLAQDTLAAREQAFALTQRMHELGATSGLVLAQNQTTVDSARLDVQAFRAQVAKDRHALALLTGGPLPPDWLPARPTPSAQQPGSWLPDTVDALTEVPAELPSTVLLLRPDVRAAEHQLRAMTANIGVARANFFPRINLTAALGTASRALSALFESDNRTWSFAPGLSVPLFDGGANRANLRVAEADRALAANAYRRTVQTAFREVADVLAERATWADRLTASQSLVAANARALELATARFKAGTDNYLAVLDAQRSLYAAQLQQIGLLQAEQLSRVALYKALGGGTALAPAAQPTP